MPKTLTPNNIFPASIPNFPLAGNSEPVAIGPLEAAIQAVFDRTENLHQSRLVVEGPGVKRIQKVASLAALQSLAGMNDGDVVDVEGYGRYRLYNPSALAADGLWVLPATGGGRWVHTLNLMRGGNSGLATLTSGGRLAQDVRDGSILTAHLANGSVTGPKLASGAAVANIGYTPLNKAGDTMTGQLINTERIFAHRQGGSGGPFISLAIGDDDTGLNWVSDGVVNMVANGIAVVQWSGFEFNVNVPIKGRYDHQRRFTVSGNVGGTGGGTLNSGTSITLQTIPVNLNNQTLRLVRARFWSNTALKLRVSNSFTWTSSNAGGEHVPNFNLRDVFTGTVIIYIDAVNDSGSAISIPPNMSWWLEFEIV
ncbi:MAG: hypothetical protein KatS3mg070_1576 [Meiothermus sp.]|uniref:hypothetical protein n=1 Tax=Meiothermus sp. TaxID=1955249 RepID=UPI0021DECB6F|nr:hypothetical protein [Meiothermus sp.]GIW28213.1 MAG: hypothetical protein KatS3mg070_1576 [Meiothermus sp.]